MKGLLSSCALAGSWDYLPSKQITAASLIPDDWMNVLLLFHTQLQDV